MKDFSTVGATEATQRRGVTAADTAHNLGDARREGREWRCRCPLHGGRSLTLRDGEGGRVLVTCWGGCDRLDVLAELRRRKLLDEGELNYRPARTPRRDSSARDTERTARALYLWRAAQPIAGTPVEHPHPSGAKLPAMVALIVREGIGAV
jgi:putative DNA primase/helicase